MRIFNGNSRLKYNIENAKSDYAGKPMEKHMRNYDSRRKILFEAN